MNYTVLQTNDDNTALVEMNIDGNLLNQNIDIGESQDEFISNIEEAMASFNTQLQANLPSTTTDIDSLIGQPQTITNLP